jgi:CRP-like cAMP-binding protein
LSEQGAPRLGDFEPFRHFAAGQAAAIVRLTKRVSFPPGRAIVREGETSADLYLVESGRVRVERQTAYGKFALTHLGEGEVFGETSYVDRAPRSSDVVTERATVVWQLPADGLDAVTADDPALSVALHWALWKSLSSKLRRTNEILAQFFQPGGPTRQPATPDPKKATGSFRVGLAAKRSLFEEQKLSSLEINFLASLSQEKRYRPGDVIFREGEEGDAMYVVLEGRVRISKFLPGAGEEALAFLERGAYFGEMALIDNKPRSADARAHDVEAVVLRIPRDVVGQLLDIRKVSSLRLLRLLCSMVAKRLREIDDKIIGWHILSGGAGVERGGEAPSR